MFACLVWLVSCLALVGSLSLLGLFCFYYFLFSYYVCLVRYTEVRRGVFFSLFARFVACGMPQLGGFVACHSPSVAQCRIVSLNQRVFFIQPQLVASQPNGEPPGFLS